jgi:hypothetical protein
MLPPTAEVVANICLFRVGDWPVDGASQVWTDSCCLVQHAGKLFAAMHAVDADALVRYHFPTERLPTHTQVIAQCTPLFHCIRPEFSRESLASQPD